MPMSYLKVAGALLLLVALGASSILIMGGDRNVVNAPLSTSTAPAGSGGLEGSFKVSIDANTRLLPGYPVIAIGPDNSKIDLYIFYDLECPFCAREFAESLGYVLNLTSEGVRVLFVDFVVHPSAVDMHAYMRCMAIHGGPYVEVLRDAYNRFAEQSKPPTLDYLKKLASNYGYKGSPDSQCLSKEKYNAVSMTQYAMQQLGVPGTPTKVIYDRERGKAWAIPGYVPLEMLKKTVEEIMAGGNPGTSTPS